LEQQQRYTLSKNDKLKSAKAIEQLFKEGQSFSLFPFRVLYLYREALQEESFGPASGHLQTAFSVSKKYFKKATDRNRIKRLMREGWRLQQDILKTRMKEANKYLSVFIIYTGNELPEHELVFKKITTVIKKLVKTCDETTIANT